MRGIMILALLLTVLLPSVAHAATVTETVTREVGIVTGDCTDPVAVPECSFAQLSVVVSDGDRPTEACVSIGRQRAVDETGYVFVTLESGCSAIAPDDLLLDPRLTSATLGGTVIQLELCDFQGDPNNPVCGPGRSVTVRAETTGTSGLTREVQTFNNVVDGCRHIIRAVHESQTGTGTLTVEGDTFSGQSQVLQSTVTERVVC